MTTETKQKLIDEIKKELARVGSKEVHGGFELSGYGGTQRYEFLGRVILKSFKTPRAKQFETQRTFWYVDLEDRTGTPYEIFMRGLL